MPQLQRLRIQQRLIFQLSTQVMGKTEVYELLCILDFNNVRKRMSVILRHNGRIRLYCKGADSIIYDHLAPGNDDNKNKTQVHPPPLEMDSVLTDPIFKEEI